MRENFFCFPLDNRSTVLLDASRNTKGPTQGKLAKNLRRARHEQYEKMNETIFVKGQARILCRECEDSSAYVEFEMTPLHKLEDVISEEANSYHFWHDGVCGICRDAELRDQAECEKADAQRKEEDV